MFTGFDLLSALGAFFTAALAAGLASERFSASSDPSESEGVRESLSSAVRAFSEFVALFVSRRDEAAKKESEPDRADESEDSNSSEGARRGGSSINASGRWREDYWNFEDNSDGDLFASPDDPGDERWKDSDGEEDENRPESFDVRWNDREERDDEQGEDASRPGSRANFFGAFFRNRNYPPDALENPEREDDSPDAPRRWRRKKSDEAPSESTDPPKFPESDAPPVGFGGAPELEETDEVEEDESDALPLFGPDFDYLSDETVPDDEKIEYLRGLVADGNEEAREELVRILLQRAATADADRRDLAFEALDEAETILREAIDAEPDAPVYGNNFAELLAQTILQRPFFYVRNRLVPPGDMTSEALSYVRAWADEDRRPEARRLLATALQIQGRYLSTLGADSTALSTLQESKAIFEELLDEGRDEIAPAIGFVTAQIAETYAKIGARAEAVSADREAVAAFDQFSDQERFLAEKVNALFQLSGALRAKGDPDGADRALEESIEAEERLYSYDEDEYFAPLSQLLEAQADVLAQRGKCDDAIASLDRAIGALEKFLTYDSIMPRRVLARSRLENALRRRAAVYMWQKRWSKAARDLDEAVQCLNWAVKKDENFSPSVQATISNCMMFDLCATFGLWDLASTLRLDLATLFSRLSTEERERVDPVYAQLLLQRRNALFRVGRVRDGIAATNEAVELLEKSAEEDSADSALQTILGKALALRGAVGSDRRKSPSALADLRRAKGILGAAWENRELDESSRLFLADFLRGKAISEFKVGEIAVAREDLALASRVVLEGLRRKNWGFFDFVNDLAISVARTTRVADSPKAALRVVKLWTRHIARLRRKYVETEWDPEDDDSERNRALVARFEGLFLNLRAARIEILTESRWDPEFAPYCDFGSLPEPLESREGERSESTPEEALQEKIESLRLQSDPAGREEISKRFVRERLGTDPRKRALFADLAAYSRVMRFRASEGDLSGLPLLVDALDKTTDLQLEADDAFAARSEALSAVRSVDAGLEVSRQKTPGFEPPPDFWVRSIPMRELLANLSARVYSECRDALALARGESSDGEPSPASETPSPDEPLPPELERLREETDDAYRKALDALRRAPISNSPNVVRAGGLGASYFAWLARTDRKEEGVAFAREEGEKLERRAEKGGRSPLDLLAVSIFYDSIARVARLDLEDDELAREALLKLVDALTEEEKHLGKAAIVTERFGNVYDRLAELDSDAGDMESALRRNREALERYEILVADGDDSARAYERFAKAARFLFENGNDADKRVAARLWRLARRRFESLDAKGRRDRVDAFWALASSAFEWFDAERNCFRAAREVLESLDAPMSDFPDFEAIRAYRRVEREYYRAIFWKKRLVWDRVAEAALAVLDDLEICREAIVKTETLSEREFARTYALNQTGRQIAIAASELCRARLELGDVEGAREAIKLGFERDRRDCEFDPVDSPFPETFFWKALRFGALWKNAFFAKIPGLRRFSRDEVDEFASVGDSTRALARRLLRTFEIVLDLDEKGFDVASREFAELAKEMKRSPSVDSFAEFSCLAVWSDALERRGQWKPALRASERALRLSFDSASITKYEEEERPFLRIDALRRAARCRFELGTSRERRRSERLARLALTLCEGALKNRRFCARPIYRSVLLLVARQELANGALDSALETTERVARAFERSEKTKLFPPTKEELETFRALEREVREKAAEGSSSREGNEDKETRK